MVFWRRHQKKLRAILRVFLDTMKTGDCQRSDKVQAVALNEPKKSKLCKSLFEKDYKLDDSVGISMEADKRNLQKALRSEMNF